MEQQEEADDPIVTAKGKNIPVDIPRQPGPQSSKVGQNGASSSSIPHGNQGTQAGKPMSNLILREVEDASARDGRSTLTGAKHQQDERERRLSSAGAITPTDSSGRKKLRNEGDLTPNAGSGPAAGPKISPRNDSTSKVGQKTPQELKTQEFSLEKTLSLVSDGGRIIVDYRPDGWGGSALVIKPKFKVITAGVKGTGQAAWAMIQTKKGVVGVLSIYAPHNERERSELWLWVKALIGEGNWIITGDLNMVEKGEDTNCESPVLKGEENLIWTDLCQDADLVDCYSVAARRAGSCFTRFQVKGTAIEMSRLDRLYLTKSGDWVDFIASITHDNRAGISDHSPVIVELHLVEETREHLIRKSYTKVSVSDLHDEAVKRKVIAAWHNHPPSVTDPRIRWDLAWRRVKSVVKEARQTKKAQEVSREDLEQLAEGWRMKLEQDNTPENREGFLIAKGMVHEKDESEAKIWRYRSRAKWMAEGEAPTKFFFSLWKANMRQEEIQMLQLEDGSVTENREQIRREIGVFYKKLFTEEGETQADRMERTEILSLINKRVTQEERKFRANPDGGGPG
ncbi:hypothetical protein R1sor_021109 [Riccia sorocarpa]|uniref:Endonuclease/exonuclease/phosphatase domain-containing protein n=1 Tax=Riccia sorocarpa TaxID=122646 RepID=A0ABD3GG58_9MARC